MESCSSLSTTPTPLWALLLIYERSYYNCYDNYMHGFKALTAWLAPIEIPTYTLIVIPNLFITYSLQQVAHQLNTHVDIIYTCMIEEVIPRLEKKMQEYRNHD